MNSPDSDTIAAYVHFPWCVKKCPYCDFNSHPLNQALDEKGYTDALLADLNAQLTSTHTISTVFFGGGTPSLFSPDAFATLLESLNSEGEVTMEANPGTTEHADFARYRAAGVNRLSIGAQSFDDSQLKQLGRIHAAEETRHAYDNARGGGFTNINIDLMYALPHQTTAGALDDLRSAIELEPEHISWYQLTLEPKTEFHKRPPQLPVDDEIAEMEEAGYELLSAHGYNRYEVSAWCRPEQECQHNLNYWRFGDYLGIGAGAHGKQGFVRSEKAKQPRLYLSDPTAIQTRTLSEADIRFESLLNILRLVDGVTWQAYESATCLQANGLAEVWQPLADQGLLSADRVAATPLGYKHLDSVLAHFLPTGE